MPAKEALKHKKEKKKEKNPDEEAVSRVRNLSEKFESLCNRPQIGHQKGRYDCSRAKIGEQSNPNEDVLVNKDRTQSNGETSWKCKLCKRAFDDVDEEIIFLECEVCHEHVCAICLNLNHNESTVMQRNDVAWTCSPGCAIVLQSAITLLNGELLNKLDEIQNGVKKVETKMDQWQDAGKHMPVYPVFDAVHLPLDDEEETTQGTEPKDSGKGENSKQSEKAENETDLKTPWNTVVGRKKVPSMETIFKEALKEQERMNEEKAREQEERKRREKNVIIYGAEEPKTSNKEKKQESDKKLVLDLLEEVGIDSELAADITRLGNPGENKDNRILPLRFTVDCTETKEKLMGSLKRLKDAPAQLSNLCICHDLTPQQREERRKLVEQAKKDSTDETIHLVRSAPGPRWDPKVVKLRRRNKKQETQLPPAEGQATSAVEQPTQVKMD
jgi:hypothetical protein